MVERVFVDAEGRLHAPWRLAVFALFSVGALLVGTLLVYPAVSAALQVIGVRFVAWPWISLFGIGVGHLLMRHYGDTGITWTQLGLDRPAAGAALLGRSLAAGALAIVAPCLVLLAVQWLRVERAGDGGWTDVALSSALVLAPAALYEELLFRGYGFVVLREAFGWQAAVAGSSLLFALVHVANPGASAQSIVLVALAGLWLGTVRVVSGSLWAAWAAHFGWNAAMLVVLHTPVSGLPFATPVYRLVDAGPAWATGGVWGPEGGAFAALGMMAVTAALLARPGGRALLARPLGRGETFA